jgi:site-specific DNA-methyltransferase (adenine-specific)
VQSILNIDARDGLAMLPDASVDMIWTDPPYRTISGGSGPDPKHRRPVGVLAANAGNGGFQHNNIDVTEYALDFFRVLTDPGHLWIMCNELNRRPMEDAMLAAGFKTHFLGAWVKNNITPNRWGLKNAELVFLFRKGAARALYKRDLKQFHPHPNVKSGSKDHPTEKPAALIRDYIEASSRPGELVLDPFAGTGNSAVAARQAGRRYLGFEIDPDYAGVAWEKLR